MKQLAPVKRHAVLLEYVILLGSFLPVIFLSAAAVYSTTGSFGVIGQQIIAFYQRIVTIISLPIP